MSKPFWGNASSRALTADVPYALVFLAIAFSVAAPREVERWQAWPLLASMALAGLPHGAGDQLVPVWAGAERGSLRYYALFFAGYLGVTAIIWLAWLASPALGTAYFLLVTVWHWGSADASHGLPEAIGSAEWAARSAARGAVIVGGPVAAHFGAAAATIAGLAHALHSAYEPSAALRVAAGSAACCGAAVEAAIAFARRDWLLIGETVLLGALVIAAPPLASVGVYFLGWHSLRHLTRLTDLRVGSPEWGWRQFGATYLRLMPMTIAALALLTGMGEYLKVRVDEANILAIYLILLSALTLPHALVTGWLDWRERDPIRAPSHLP